MAKETVEMLDLLDEQHIELDIEEVRPKKINLYYGV
jgi:D-arabinose 1-dehydrogenase-like Zn-dependent alcohol dehydrogenase